MRSISLPPLLLFLFFLFLVLLPPSAFQPTSLSTSSHLPPLSTPIYTIDISPSPSSSFSYPSSSLHTYLPYHLPSPAKNVPSPTNPPQPRIPHPSLPALHPFPDLIGLLRPPLARSPILPGFTLFFFPLFLSPLQSKRRS